MNTTTSTTASAVPPSMQIDTYQSKTDDSKWLSVPAGTDISKIKIQDPDYAMVKVGKKLTIKAGEKRAGMDADRVLGDIAAKGHALHGAEIEITVKT